MKKTRLLWVVMVILISLSFSFAEGISVKLNGEILTFDVQPQLIQNRTMVPIRVIFEALDLEVGWDPQTQTVTGTGNERIITLQVGNLEAVVNDQPVQLDMSAVIVEGRTLVPVRFIAESLGAEVGWNQEIKQVTIQYFADEESKLKSEINGFLVKEQQLILEWQNEKKKSDDFEAIALSAIERLKGEYTRLIDKKTELMSQYSPIDFKGDTYYGPVNASRRMNGFGYYQYQDGDFFIGDTLNGDYSGFGLYVWTSGAYYIGQFKSNDFHGIGFVNTNESYYKYGTYVNDKSLGQVYFKDYTEDYVFVGNMDGSDFKNGRQRNENGSEQLTWKSPSSHKLMTVETYDDGEFFIYEEADPKTGFSFTIETFFLDTHLIRYMNVNTEENNGKGVSYIVGSDYVYYGEFFDRVYEKAEDISYYNMKGNFFEFRDKIDSILAEIIVEGMTDLEKEKAIHDYIVKASRYNPDEVIDDEYPAAQHMAYEIILTGEGICEAYAEVMNIMLLRVGIPSVILGGNVGDEGDEANWGGHAWNYVKIDNNYYHVDATWDDPIPDNPKRISNEYFNVTDTFIARDHEWEESLDEINAFKLKYPLQ